MLTLVLTIVLVLHALFALVLWYEMQPKAQLQQMAEPVETDQAMFVRLIDAPKTPRAAPPPAPPAQAPPLPQPVAIARPRPVVHEKPHNDAMVVQDHEAKPAPAVSVATPSAVTLNALPPPAAAETSYASTNPKIKAAKPTDDSQIMQHDYNRMHTKTTRFEKYFPPPNETAGGAAGRHIGNAIQAIAKSICDPKRTGFNPLCGAPPIPPSPKDGDERLSLPPASLTGDDPNPAKPTLASCIAEYKDTKPLSDGCPLNTPDLAFKAEVDECVALFRAGKRLKTWCPPDTARRAETGSSAPAAASSSAASH